MQDEGPQDGGELGMQKFVFYLKLAAAVVLVFWGGSSLLGLVNNPEKVDFWIEPLMIVPGIALAAWTIYTARKGALLVGAAFLAITAMYAWNMQYFFDPERIPEGWTPEWDLYVEPSLFLILGIFFSVFFRYLYPKEAPIGPVPTSDVKLEGQAPSVAQESIRSAEHGAKPSTARLAPVIVRLTLLACSAGLALVPAKLLGVEGTAGAQVFIVVFVVGCLATGLISEETLTKIIQWKKS